MVLFAHHVRVPVLIDPFVQPAKQDGRSCVPRITKSLISSDAEAAIVVIEDDISFARDAIVQLWQLCEWYIHRSSQMSGSIGVRVTQVDEDVGLFLVPAGGQGLDR